MPRDGQLKIKSETYLATLEYVFDISISRFKREIIKGLPTKKEMYINTGSDALVRHWDSVNAIAADGRARQFTIYLDHGAWFLIGNFLIESRDFRRGARIRFVHRSVIGAHNVDSGGTGDDQTSTIGGESNQIGSFCCAIKILGFVFLCVFYRRSK